MQTGGVVGIVRRISNAYTVLPMDKVILIDIASDYAVTLPAAASMRGRWISFVALRQAAAFTATITCAGSDKIRTSSGDVATRAFTVAGDHLQIFSDGAGWFIISAG